MKLNKRCNLIFVLLTLKAVTLGALEWMPEEKAQERDPFAWTALSIKNENPIEPIPVVLVPEKKQVNKPLAFEWHLSAISNSSTPCALLVRENQTVVVRTQEEIGQGWKIDKISATSVICKHQSGERKELWL